MSEQTLEEILRADPTKPPTNHGEYLLRKAILRQLAEERYPLFFNPPKYLVARYIAERGTWQLFSGVVVVFEHKSQKEVLCYLLHWGYEEVAPGCYYREEVYTIAAA